MSALSILASDLHPIQQVIPDDIDALELDSVGVLAIGEYFKQHNTICRGTLRWARCGKDRFMTADLQQTARPTKAVGYARISSKAQEAKGDGLGSQEACIREYARQKGYEVEKVFREVLTGEAETAL